MARSSILAVLIASTAAELPRQRSPTQRLTPAQQAEITSQLFARSLREYAQLGRKASDMYVNDDDLVWQDSPGAWHQQLARIVDHRFISFDELYEFATKAKKAGVSALMLVQIQKTEACPGPWYNGLQLCDHINGSYPVSDGSLAQWQKMLEEIKPMRLMWWTNPTYWSVQGQVWQEAVANRESDVGKWFSWGPQDCAGIPPCDGRNVVGNGWCAQGSWGSEGMNSGVKSAMASFGSQEYANYMVDAMANSWTRNLGIDGYTEDCSADYSCMLQLTDPEHRSLVDWAAIVGRVRQQQPQLVMSGEGYSSWADMILADANLGGQGYAEYHTAMQKAVFDGDASDLESFASTSGADAATVLCYLNPAYDGKQPGACPTMYFRDTTATIKDIKQHQLWVALEAGSGIVPQHDYDPDSTCQGWVGCDGGRGAWWNVTNDPFEEGTESPLWAFRQYRSLNRLAIRTKLNMKSASPHVVAPVGYTKYEHANCYTGSGGRDIDENPAGPGLTDAECTKRCDDDDACACVTYCAEGSGACGAQGYCWKRSQCVPEQFERDEATIPYTVYVKNNAPTPSPSQAGGAIAYLKHDALGPAGDACIMVMNPGKAQSVTIDLSSLPPDRLDGSVKTFDLMDQNKSGPALASQWTVSMGAGEVKAFGGFGLGTFAPRKGKKSGCVADDAYARSVPGTTLQDCFLECLKDTRCENVFVEYVDIKWMEKPPAMKCTLLGILRDPSAGCKPGTGTLVKKLINGRPSPITII